MTCSRIGITILMSKHRFFKKLIKQVVYDGWICALHELRLVCKNIKTKISNAHLFIYFKISFFFKFLIVCFGDIFLVLIIT